MTSFEPYCNALGCDKRATTTIRERSTVPVNVATVWSWVCDVHAKAGAA